MIASATNIGLKRTENQDFLGTEQLASGLLLVVCDGMGGHRGGAHASRTAVRMFTDALRTPDSPSTGTAMREAVLRTNAALYAEARRDPELRGMGTTLVAAVLNDRRVTIANIGDSRAYRFGAGGLRRITFDHSLVGELVNDGRITEEEALRHPQRNIITRAIGIDAEAEADIFDITLDEGETLLLCSDGLHAMISDDMIASLLRREPRPERAADLLIDAALQAGGSDNVTLILARPGHADDSAMNPATIAAAPPPNGNSRRWLTGIIALAVIGVTGWVIFGDQLRPPPAATPFDSTAYKAFQNDVLRLYIPARGLYDSAQARSNNDSTGRKRRAGDALSEPQKHRTGEAR